MKGRNSIRGMRNVSSEPMEIEDKLEQLLIECEVNPTFTPMDIHLLVTHFQRRDYNQYSLVLVDNVLKVKDYGVPKSEVVPLLLGWLGDSEYLSNIEETDEDSAIQLSILLFRFLYIIDIEDIMEISL